MVSDVVSPHLVRRFSARDGAFPLTRSQVVALPAGVDFETTLAIESGTLVLALPEGFAVPGRSTLRVRLASEDGIPAEPWETRWCSRGVPSAQERWTSSRCHLGALAIGRYSLRVDASDTEGGGEEALCPSFERVIEIRRHETTLVAIPCAR